MTEKMKRDHPYAFRLLFGILLGLLLCGIPLALLFKLSSPGLFPKLPVHGQLPAFSLLSHEGRIITRDELLGRTTVASFIFTRCPTFCPRLTAVGNEGRGVAWCNDNRYSGDRTASLCAQR